MAVKPTPLLDRIAAKCEPRPNGCLVWTGRFDFATPMIDITHGSSKNVRRILYEQETGELIGRLNTPRMTCTTHGCVLPGHVKIGPINPRADDRAALPVAAAPVDELPVPKSVLPRHLKYCTAVRSVWDLGRVQA